MKKSFLAVVAVFVAVILVVCAIMVFIPRNEGSTNTPELPPGSHGSTPELPPSSHEYMIESINSSNWNYWLGSMDLPGVSDAKTPIESSDLQEMWKISDVIDSSSMTWKVPGSAICVENKTYYFRGLDNSLYCVNTATGNVIAKVECISDSVYNMSLAHGDGKIFVPCRDGGYTVMKVFDAATLKQLFVSEPVSGGEVQGSIIYHNGYVYFGTYGGSYACFKSADTDTSKSNEVAKAAWILDAKGFYNATPVFIGGYCIIAEKGYDVGGAVIYVLNAQTGAVYDIHKLSYEYCVSGLNFYKGRLYIAVNAVEDPSNATTEQNTGKILKIHSFEINSDGEILEATKKTWSSSAKDGGTQSTPVIYNDRLYIGGGGSTMGSNEPFHVLNIASNGNMTLAYSIELDTNNDGVVDGLFSKGTASITVGYASEENGYAVYIYLIEYGKIIQGDTTGLKGSASIYVLKDSKGQTSQDIVFTYAPSVEQFAYQSFSISPEGYLLIRNDSTLFCLGHVGLSGSHTAEDVENAIDRIIACGGNYKEAGMAEYRYSQLSTSEKLNVSNYQDLQNLYHTITFVISESESIDVKVPHGSIANQPYFEVPVGKVLIGWEGWNIWKDVVTDDITLMANYEDAVIVSFDSNGGSSIDSVYVRKNSVLGYAGIPERDGYTFGGWFLNNVEYSPMYSKVSEAITLKALWFSNHTISFDSDGGSAVNTTLNVISGMAIGELPTTNKPGYSFDGWYYGDTLYTKDTMFNVNSDIVLKAKWSANDSVIVSTEKGIKVSGAMPSDSKLSALVPYLFGSDVLKIKNYASESLDYVLLTLHGDGLSHDILLTVELPVGNEFSSTKAYYYDSAASKVMEINGTLSGGILKVDFHGNTTTSGIDIVMGISSGSTLNDYL